MSLDSLHVEVEISAWEAGDSVRFLAPPIYADNPLLESTGNNFRNLVILDGEGRTVEYFADSQTVGLYKALTIAFPESRLPVGIEYDVGFSYNDTVYPYMPRPGIGEKTGYLQGSYMFMVPYTNLQTVHVWRDRFDLRVTYDLGDNVVMYGDPPVSGQFRNPYELMFSVSAVLDRSVAQSKVLAEGTAGGQAYRFVTVSDAVGFSSTLQDGMLSSFETLLDDICSVFGGLSDHPMTVILGANTGGGLEGVHAFTVLDPAEGDPDGTHNDVMVHETLHFWIGVRTGEYDLAWWKEGTTAYLGLVTARRNALCSLSRVENHLLRDLSDSVDVQNFSLSDPVVRARVFERGRQFRSLVYVKGAQVSMLLDRAIRAGSGNTVSLETVTSELTSLYDGTAFYRSEYIDYIEQRSGVQVDTLFSEFVDGKGAIPDSVLAENLDALIALGAFGATGLARRELAASPIAGKAYAPICMF